LEQKGEDHTDAAAPAASAAATKPRSGPGGRVAARRSTPSPRPGGAVPGRHPLPDRPERAHGPSPHRRLEQERQAL